MSGHTDNAAGLLSQAADLLTPGNVQAIQNQIPVEGLEGLREVLHQAMGVIAQAGSKPQQELSNYVTRCEAGIDQYAQTLNAAREAGNDLLSMFAAAQEVCTTQAGQYT